jgi:peptidoglycan/xylan/chitin deacetylase (PgdA/CDA1 family)
MREEKRVELLSGLLPFLIHNLGQEVMIRIGLFDWRYIKVLRVDADAHKLHYEESEKYPRPVTMELRHIDGFQSASSASAKSALSSIF